MDDPYTLFCQLRDQTKPVVGQEFSAPKYTEREAFELAMKQKESHDPSTH